MRFILRFTSQISKKTVSTSSDEDTASFVSDDDDTFDLSTSEESDDGLMKSVDATVVYVPQVGDNVIVQYEGEHWPGVVLNVHKSGITVSCMERSGNFWKWPTVKDILIYKKSDIICKISVPMKVSSKRDMYNVPELKEKWGTI